MVKNKRIYTQNEAVLSYLKAKRKSKLTTEQICSGIKTHFGTKLTNTQVSKCLNRFSENKLVAKTTNGITSTGRKAFRWYYTPTKS